MRKYILFLCISLAVYSQKVGINGAKFLNVGIGARAAGMAEAFVPVADDASAVFWNPAGIAKTEGKISVFFDHNEWWAGTAFNSIAVVGKRSEMEGWGVFLSLFDSGEIEQTLVENENTGRYVSYTAFQTGISYAKYLTEKFVVGLNLKYFSEIYPSPEEGTPSPRVHDVAIDIGTLFHTDFKSLRLGMSLTNFGPDARPSGSYLDYADGVIQDSAKSYKHYPLPLTFRGGLAMEVLESDKQSLTLSVVGVHPSDNLERLSIGMEYAVHNEFAKLFLRTGYELNRDTGGFSSGIGIKVPFLALDVSYSDGGFLPWVTRVSLNLVF
ncbi:hypothetical protein DRQ20_00125 [bacterium]|nr:MAG: hypothetical protein DRQ20_00125 [bacterium]